MLRWSRGQAGGRIGGVIGSALVAVAAVLVLSGCGGGGGGGDAGFVVTGVITPDALNRVDSDTNDGGVTAVRNDAPDSAQRVLAPALIGGFVAAPGTQSRFSPAGDEYDFYRVDLTAGQQVVLESGSTAAAELALYLLRADGAAVDASVGPEAALSLEPDADGTYFVGVRALAGTANYTLRLGGTHSQARESRRAARASDTFVPSELIVRTRPWMSQLPPFAQAMGLRAVAGHPSREQRWRIPQGQARGMIAALSGWRPPASFTLRWASAELEERYLTLRLAKSLEGMDGVRTVSLNHLVRAVRLPNDPLQGLQWFHRSIDLPRAWDLGTVAESGSDVVVAVIDTGVFLGHEDLQGHLLQGYDFVRMQPTGDDPGDPSNPGQSSWHGTHVAGVAGATTNNGKGVAGVTWGAKILPVRTLTDRGGTLYDTLQGIRYAAGLPNDSNTVPERVADVINLSLGGGSFTQAEADLYQQIRDAGIFVIAAAGNNAGAVSFPAAYDAVFAVGATDAVNARAHYSSFGNQLDLVAPGGDMRVDRTGDGYGDGILSTLVDDSSGARRSVYAFYQGTSMSTAVVSGVAALARALAPETTPDRFAQLLVGGLLTDDLGPEGWDPETGWGQINAARTLLAVTSDGATELAPLLVAKPGRLEFGLTEDTAEFTLSNLGGGSPRVVAVHGTESWVTVTAGAVNALDGLGSYRVTIDRGGLADGEYESVIQVDSDGADDLAIPVVMRVAPAELARDTVGRIYVLLLDSDGETVAERALDLKDGGYAYRFDGIPEGQYRIAAGTDMNGDGRICDAGEACGAYPTLSLFERVQIDRNRSGLDFSVGFRARVGDSILGAGEGGVVRHAAGPGGQY